MAIQFYMRGYNPANGQYVDWVVNDQPDSAGTFAPVSPLTNIVVNRTVQSKIQNFLKSVVPPSYIENAYGNNGVINPTDGYLFHLNSYDWLNPAPPGPPITIPPYNQPTGIAVVRGSSSPSSPFTPNQYASLFWTEEPSNAGFWTFAYLEPNGSVGMALPVNMGALNIIGHLGVQDTSTDPEAQTGLIRIPNSQAIKARDFSNSSDITLLTTDGYNDVILGDSSHNVIIGGTSANTMGSPAANTVTIAGNLLVYGTTTTIESITVDIIGRVIHGNWSTGPLSPPAKLAGYSVHRGSPDGVTQNDGAGLIWIEGTQVASGADGFWITATLPNDVDTGALTPAQANLANIVKMMTGGVYVSSTPNPSLITLPTVGGLRVQNATPAVVARNAGGTADIHMISTDNLNHIIHGGKATVNNTGHIFSTNTGGLYDFQVNGVSQVQIGQDNIIFANTDGYAAISQAPTVVTSATGATMSITAQAALGALGIGGNLFLGAGHGTVVDGYAQIAGSSVNLVADGYVVAAAEQNKFAFLQGRRRNITQVFDDGYVFDGYSYYEIKPTDDYIAVTGLNAVLNIILPTNPILGDVYEVVDATLAGQASIYNIVVYGNGQYINGGLVYTISTSYGSARFTFTGLQWNAG